MTENGSPQESGEDRLAALLRVHAGQLETFIARRVRGDVQAVEDLVQQTIMYVVAYYDRNCGFPPGTEVVRLLFTIAKRRVINWYERSEKADLCPSDSMLLAEAVTSVDSIDEVVAQRLDLARALARLSVPQQRALILVYVDGLDYRTAAAYMGISVDGVKKHLRSAKERARQLDELIGYRATASAEGDAQ